MTNLKQSYIHTVTTDDTVYIEYVSSLIQADFTILHTLYTHGIHANESIINRVLQQAYLYLYHTFHDWPALNG